jgi:type I restriction enzyme S subunit
MTWQLVNLGDVCQQDRCSIKPGQSEELPYLGLECIESGTGQLLTGAMSKTPESPQANSFQFDSRHVLYGKLRPYLNKVALPEATGKCSTEIIPLLPNDGVDRRYLAYFLRSPSTVNRISETVSGARMPRADMNMVFGLQMPLPPLKDQQHIVDLLTRAEGIVRLRREAAAKAAELIPAIFIDMFGDPLTNPKQLSIRKVEDVVAKFEGGKNIQAGDGEASNLRILKVSAVTSGTYVESECKPAPNDYVPPTQHFVRVGDMLFSRANTSELVGATALVEHTNGSTLLPDKLWRFVWKAEVDPFYMWALFQSKAVRQQLSKLASGTSDSMRNISQAKLFALDLPIAKLEDQRRFGELINSARSIQVQQQTALMQAQATFNALLAQAFAPRGGL